MRKFLLNLSVLFIFCGSTSGFACLLDPSPQGNQSRKNVPFASNIVVIPATEKANAPNLILIHGVGGKLNSWSPVVNELTKTHNVMIYEVKGHGDTPATNSDFSSAKLANELAVLMDHAGMQQAVVMGCSMGARIAVRAAELFPERISGVVVEDMHLKKIGRFSEDLARARAKFEEVAKTTVADYETDVHFLIAKQNASSAVWFAEGLSEDMTDALKAIKVPVFFLAGDAKYGGTGYAATTLFGKGIEHIRATSPGSVVVEVFSASHGIHYSHAGVVLKLLTEFTTAVERGDAEWITPEISEYINTIGKRW